MKKKNISESFPLSSILDDWEILASIMYCNKILRAEKPFDNDLLAISQIFFDSDFSIAIETIEGIVVQYEKEYCKRHKN